MTGTPARHETIDEVLAALDNDLDRCVDCGDAGGYFVAVYRAVTQRVRDGIGRGEFADGERMERFDVMFAERYLDARWRWERGEPVPDAWRVAFETTAARRCLVMQHLLLGVNAHINLDLGLAAAASTDPGEVAELRDDFEKINDVLAELVDRMQASIAAVSPWTRVVDIAGLRFDEALVTFSLRRARADAWDFATELTSASPTDRLEMERRRDAQVAALGARIARPGGPLRLLVGAASRWERHDLDDVICAMVD